MRLRDLLLSPPPSAAVRVAAVDGVRSELLAQSRTLGGPMFKRLTVGDLERLFALYAAGVFAGAIGEA
ncbi:MAG: hypothetical protein R3F65_29985, partial [bacterium]